MAGVASEHSTFSFEWIAAASIASQAIMPIGITLSEMPFGAACGCDRPCHRDYGARSVIERWMAGAILSVSLFAAVVGATIG